MLTSSHQPVSNSFLHGKGEMATAIREFSWEQTSVGPMTAWPQSLYTTLNIMINSRFPMFLWWGGDLTCFYNDAYRPSLGNEGKHPFILGMPAKKAWPEIWDIISPLIQQVLETGEPVWSQDQLVPIFRNGKIEDVYWTFSYSAVYLESGKINGVLVTCTETTTQVLSLKKIEASERNFRNLVDTAPVPAVLYRGRDLVIELANEELLRLWGKDKSLIGKKLTDAIPELINQSFIDILLHVYETGETYEGKEMFAWWNKEGKEETAYFNLVYKAIKDIEGNVDGILAMGFDVTEQILSRKKIEELEERTRLAVDAGMLGTFDYNMQTGEMNYSPRLAEIFGIDHQAAVHTDFVTRIHPDDLPVRKAAFAEAERTGHLAYEARVIWPDRSLHWIKSQGKIFKNNEQKPLHVIGIVNDITQDKNFVAELETSERKFRNTVMQAPVGITILRGKDFIVEMANETYLRVVDKNEEQFVGKGLFETLPEVQPAVEPFLNNVLKTGEPYFGNEFEVLINRYGKKERAYFNFVYKPLYEKDASIGGVIVIANEVTQLVEARHVIEENEKKFSQIYMQSPIAMAILRGENFIIETANVELLNNIWYKKPEEVIGKSILEAFPELTKQKYAELLRTVYYSATTHREKEAVAYFEGNAGLKKFYLDFEYSPLFNTDGTVSGIMHTVYDVTENVLFRKKIEESEEKFRLLADSMPQHIWTSDVRGRLNYFNRSVFEYTGLDLAELQTQGWSRILHPDDRERNITTWLKSINTGEPFLIEHRFRRRDGKYRWQLSRALPVIDNNGVIQMWVGTSTDIDEIKKQQEEKDDFIKIASHELKTPITTIKAYVQLMLDQERKTLDPLLSKSLAAIDRQVNKLVKLISDLLDVTRIETGSFHSEKETFSMTELIRDTIASVQATASSHQLLFNETRDITVEADRDRLTQVITNLLTNAIKYSPGSNLVIVHTRIENGELITSVQDFGLGIAREDHEKIFTRFYRAGNMNGKSYPGFGIGLYIVRQIVSQHAGRTWVESEINKGTTFHFSLPL
jgi:PAS domain S-box-containing protein